MKYCGWCETRMDGRGAFTKDYGHMCAECYERLSKNAEMIPVTWTAETVEAERQRWLELRG